MNNVMLSDESVIEGGHLTPEERIALQAEEIKQLWQENEQLKADLRGKDNEINDLKALIEYLRKFKPKKNETVREAYIDFLLNLKEN